MALFRCRVRVRFIKQAQIIRKRMKMIIADDSNGSISIEPCESCFEKNSLDFEDFKLIPSLPNISSSNLRSLQDHRTKNIDFRRNSTIKTFLIIDKDLSRKQWVIKTNNILIKNILNQRKDKQNFSNFFETDNQAVTSRTRGKLKKTMITLKIIYQQLKLI
jgi:hypothetical protein